MPDIVEKIAFILTEEPEVTLEELSRLASRFAINLNARIQRHENDKATSAYKEIFLLDVTHVTVQTIASNFSRHSLLAVKKNIREIQAWSKLRHENVLPVLGITTEFDGSIALVYERMDRGNAHDYVQDESVDPRPLIVEIALGLQYLHNHTPSPIFHGNLRGVCFFHIATRPHVHGMTRQT
ncbi:hypothetical protein ID866_10467 [Astraeus odoratus]|nr:hypothetical protein ID866_10467 [Astraeus odoratus]